METQPKVIQINIMKIIGLIGLLITLVGINWLLIIKNIPVYGYLLIYGPALMLWYGIHWLSVDLGFSTKKEKVIKRRIGR